MEYLVPQGYAHYGGQLEQCETIAHVYVLERVVGGILHHADADDESHERKPFARLHVTESAPHAYAHHGQLQQREQRTGPAPRYE